MGLQRPLFDLDAVYLEATRLGPNVSNMLMMGIMIEADLENWVELIRPKATKGHEEEGEILMDLKITTAGLVINNSVFVALHPTLVIFLHSLTYSGKIQVRYMVGLKSEAKKVLVCLRFQTRIVINDEPLEPTRYIKQANKWFEAV